MSLFAWLWPKGVVKRCRRCSFMTGYEKLSSEVLDNETKSPAFALVILKMLKTAAAHDESLVSGA